MLLGRRAEESNLRQRIFRIRHTRAAAVYYAFRGVNEFIGRTTLSLLREEKPAATRAAERILETARRSAPLVAKLSIFGREYGYIVDHQVHKMTYEDMEKELSTDSHVYHTGADLKRKVPDLPVQPSRRFHPSE